MYYDSDRLMKFLSVKVPKNNEYTYEQGLALFSSLAGLAGEKKFFDKIFGIFSKHNTGKSFSFNILSAKQRIHFIVAVEESDVAHISNQILAQYPKAEISETRGFKFRTPHVYELIPSQNDYLMIRTMDHYKGVDPMASILSTISRSSDPKAVFWLQIVVSPTSSAWQSRALSHIDALSQIPEGGAQTQSKRSQLMLIQEKIKYQGLHAYIRILSNTEANLNLFYSAFNVYAQASGNSFIAKEPRRSKREKYLDAINTHKPYGSPCILNTLELASIWHLPTAQVTMPNIVWGKKLTLEAPENLPIVSPHLSEEEKNTITFFGKTQYRNTEAIFGIKNEDRLKHMYIVGKTGTGKSTLLENMAIDDIRKGHGVAILDPHGDMVKHIMEYIPKKRIPDVCFFNPSDPEYAYPLNILDIPNRAQRELMVSGIIAIFYKLYGNSWGPRLEYILRNVLFTLVHVDGATLNDILTLLLDKNYRKKVVEQLEDPVLIQFWEKEFERMDPKLQNEAISPILNKVGQFVTSPIIRNIIGHSRSKVKIDEIMNSGKILLCDLSQGKIGEDNATLLGSMLITQIQIAAMNRAFLDERDRRPFYLYVDEFQNFATSSFIKILSEARKYKLALTMANQYINQIDPTIINAILGNIGTLVTLAVGAQDSQILSNEFGQTEVTPEDLSTLERFQMITRMSIDFETVQPFQAFSLPLPKNVSGHYDKIVESSRQRFGVPLNKIKTKVPPASPDRIIKPQSQKHPQNKSQQNYSPHQSSFQSQKPMR